MILDILKHPNENLRKKSRPVTDEEILSADFKEFIKDLSVTMFKRDGIGLAAPQVDNQVRAIVINANDQPIVFINPEITKKSWRQTVMEEGCLSIPDTYEKVKRPKSIVVNFQDLNAKPQKIKADDLLARVLQHEIDHLDGVLFIDKIKK